MDIFEHIDHLIDTKSWGELTSEEKDFIIKELGSKEKFESLKRTQILLTSQRNKSLNPNPAVLISLQKKFSERIGHVTVFQKILSLQMPAIAAALLIVLIASLAFYLGKNQTQTITEIQKVTLRDTLFLTTKPDTVFIPKKIYIKEKVFVNQAETITLTQTPATPRGVTMKETEALENFLVSGSE